MARVMKGGRKERALVAGLSENKGLDHGRRGAWAKPGSLGRIFNMQRERRGSVIVRELT